MITEDYVSFETAKLLKEKGFDDINCECHGWIGRSGKHYSADDTFYDDKELKKAQEDRKDFIPLITLQMAMKWLREVHRLFISIGNDDLDYNWQIFDVRNRTKNLDPTCLTDSYAGYRKYEQACEVAIKYCLENLI